MIQDTVEMFRLLYVCVLVVTGAITLIFIAGTYATFLFEIIPDKWQEYRERKQKVRKTDAHTN